MSARVIVIGAGPGGLATSMLLGKAGFDVTVVERQEFVGGRTSTLSSNGFRFDRGPTFFLYPRILQEVFAESGYDLFQEIEMVRLDPQYRLIFGSGGQLDATPNMERMEREIARIAPADAAGLRPFLAENGKKLDAFRTILESPFSRRRDFLRPDVLRSLPMVRPWRSLHREVGRHFQDPRLKLAFTFQGKYLGMSPFQCPSLFSILAFLEYQHGVFHPVGGCGAVSRVMARLARQLGVRIALDEPVERILFRGKRAVGVQTSKETYEADAVVVNADFAHAMGRLVPDHLRRRWTDRRIARKKFSCSTFMLYLGLDGTQHDLPHHTIYLSKDYVENLKDIEQRHCLSKDPSFYVQNANVTDSTVAPPGSSTLYVLVPVTHHHEHVDWRRETPHFRSLIFQQLKKVGLHKIEKRVVCEQVVTPEQWQRDHHIYRGATFNMAHSLRQMLYFRPHNRFEDLEAVYLVGGGTHPGSGLPVIYSSAKITAQAMIEDFGGCPGLNSGQITKSPGIPSTGVPAHAAQS